MKIFSKMFGNGYYLINDDFSIILNIILKIRQSIFECDF